MTRCNRVMLYCIIPLFLAPFPAQPQASISGVVETYCDGCHNGQMKSPSGVTLTKFDPTTISSDRETWTRVSRMLRAGVMPPAGAPRPDRLTYERTVALIDRSLDTPVRAVDAGQAIAARLATVLWDSAPDAALLKEVNNNRLKDPAVLEAQVKRMLADPKAETFVTRFFFAWLQLDQRGGNVDKRLYPEYNEALRESMLRETQQFLLSQLREDRDPIELWTANYTFLNEQLATHYGVPAIKGAELRRHTWTTQERAGLLGQGSVLMLTSRLDSPYTSPAARSLWLRRHFYGVNPPNPFPGAQPVKSELPITPQTRTLPENPCGNCHRNFFPLAYSLENFDSLGRWRTHDQMGAVDASGTFVDGTLFANPAEFRKGLVRNADAFRTTITERLIIFAAGKPVKPIQGSPDTLSAARQILRDQPRSHWSSLIAAVIRSKPPAVE